MPASIQNFGKSARGLTRNPLGIIALFLVLVYAFAALLLGASARNIDVFQRWALVGFLVVFPMVVLALFYRLVTRHHSKLYAPGDYRDESLFVRSLSPEEQRNRLESEVAEAEGIGFGEDDPPPTSSPTPENGLSESQRRELRFHRVLAQDLAFRQLQEELGIVFRRQVLLGAPRRDLAFDGIAEREDKILVVDVKYLPSMRSRLPGVDGTLKRFFDASQYVHSYHSGRQLEPILVVVFSHLLDADRPAIEKRMKDATMFMNLDLRIFSLDRLRQRYGVEDATIEELQPV